MDCSVAVMVSKSYARVSSSVPQSYCGKIPWKNISWSVLLVLNFLWVHFSRVQCFLEAVAHATSHEYVADDGGALGGVQAGTKRRGKHEL